MEPDDRSPLGRSAIDEAAPPVGRARRGAERRPFVVKVAALRKALGTSRHDVRRGLVSDLRTVSVAVPDGVPVETDLTLSSYPGGIMAKGSVRAAWAGECRRCGGPVGGRLEARVRERFVAGGSEDEDAYPLTGDQLDLEPLARDAVLLELPLAPLCSPDCLGLCPVCGTNRNEAMCDCTPGVDPRWSALDGLREH